MESNRQMLNSLLDKNEILIRRGHIFDMDPGPMNPGFDFERVEGMMLGLAIGDALGITSEGMLPEHRRLRHGEIRDYIPNRYVDKPIGFPSDDTQLAFWTLEQIIADRRFNPDHVAKRFCQDKIFGIGAAVREFVGNFGSGRRPWYRCGSRSAGNGALMRIAPMVIPHLKTGTSDLWVDTALSAMITHNDSGSIAACIAFVKILWQALKMDRVPEPHWWLETYVATGKDLELDIAYRPRGGSYTNYHGPIWRFIEKYVSEAYREGSSVVEACNRWYSGAFLLETVPSVIFILMKHGGNAEEAIVRAVNDTKDNDTIAAIVGAAVGALHGRKGLPQRWIANLSGRTTDRDDRRIFGLLKEAKGVEWDC